MRPRISQDAERDRHTIGSELRHCTRPTESQFIWVRDAKDRVITIGQFIDLKLTYVRVNADTVSRKVGPQSFGTGKAIGCPVRRGRILHDNIAPVFQARYR
jgi:hypothetical protein